MSPTRRSARSSRPSRVGVGAGLHDRGLREVEPDQPCAGAGRELQAVAGAAAGEVEQDVARAEREHAGHLVEGAGPVTALVDSTWGGSPSSRVHSRSLSGTSPMSAYQAEK